MKILLNTVQIIVALGLINVWVLRFRKKTPYRGGSSETLPGEFAAYGLPPWSLWLVGSLKLGCALLFLAGIWVPKTVAPSAIVLTLLMLGAIFMHMKVRDPLLRSLPATLMLGMSVFLFWCTV
jgi:uncharacterized membrane protein YphA (DoxX/SURF4 family)